ncbi:hypothetical protein GCM10010340_47730 [Streptomyces griseoloalbus]|nr:hypothetical protein GCM10010340_47730 [Streptomyces albaduncus]
MRSQFVMPDWTQVLHRVPSLTSRELEVFELLAYGSTNAEISEHLVVTERTVRAHTGSILSKLGLRSRLTASLAAFAYTQKVALPPGNAEASASPKMDLRKKDLTRKQEYRHRPGTGRDQGPDFDPPAHF